LDSGEARQSGDKFILKAKPATYNISGSTDDYSEVQGGNIEVTAEGDITEDQLQELIALHQKPVVKDSRHRRNEALPHRVDHAEPTTIDDDFVIVRKTSKDEEEIVCTEADALMYFTNRNHLNRR